MTDIMDLRESQRTPVDFQAEIRVPGTDQKITADVADMSENGLRIVAPSAFDAGTVLVVSIEPKAKDAPPVTVSVTVVRSIPGATGDQFEIACALD